MDKSLHKPSFKLNELQATAICGNDISSSCLYVAALTISYAGQYAWISLIVVGLVLYLFRKIYGEVVGALPLNGGAYNVLLNTTSKSTASFAACLTILSYMATAYQMATHHWHHGALINLLYPIGDDWEFKIIAIRESDLISNIPGFSGCTDEFYAKLSTLCRSDPYRCKQVKSRTLAGTGIGYCGNTDINFCSWSFGLAVVWLV